MPDRSTEGRRSKLDLKGGAVCEKENPLSLTPPHISEGSYIVKDAWKLMQV